MVRLVVLTGPIGAGKSTVAELVARRLANRHGRTAAIADLDDLAFAQRAHIDLDEMWRRAGIAHTGLVKGWFEAGVDVVIAHGPFFESRSYDDLFATAPSEATALHVVLDVDHATAVQRVKADDDRRPDAMSKDPDFLRRAHAAFDARRATLPPAHRRIDTTRRTPRDIADEIVVDVMQRDR